MTITDTSYVGIAIPIEDTPASEAYWRTGKPIKDLMAEFSFKSSTKLSQSAGDAVLKGFCCIHCKEDLVVTCRTSAIAEIKAASAKWRHKIECRPCYRKASYQRQKDAWDRSAARRAARNTDVQPKNEKAEFYLSWEWRTLRTKVLQQYGARCMCCGATPEHKTIGGEPVAIVVDHIKPLSKRWDLRLDRGNLQVLCQECNQGKGAWDETDYRPVPKTENGDVIQ